MTSAPAGLASGAFLLEAPKYRGGDYGFTYVNGEIITHYFLPFMPCLTCRGRTGHDQPWAPLWSTPAVQGSKECRAGARHRLPPKGSREWKDHEARFLKIRSEFLVEARADPRNAAILRADVRLAGAPLLPVTLKVPSRPSADVLHPDGGLVFSGRLVARLRETNVAGVAFTRIDDLRAGKGDPRDRAPIPEGGEPEDLAQLAAPLRDVQAGDYYLVHVTARTGLPCGALLVETCPDCGGNRYDTSKRRWELSRANAGNTDFAILATTLHVVVSSRVKEAIDSMPQPNTAFTGLAIVDDC